MWPVIALLVTICIWAYCTHRFPIPLTELEQDMADAPEQAPTRFRKKPIEVEAMQWDGSYASAVAIISWGGVENFDYHPAVVAPQQNDLQPSVAAPARFSAITLEGPLTISVNDWVIRGAVGEVYPIKPEILAVTYDEMPVPLDLEESFTDGEWDAGQRPESHKKAGGMH